MTEPIDLLETSLDERRFGGLQRLYGLQGAQRIRQAHVVVAGIGGVGSWVAEALARSGVARLTLVDMDHISESNINRQIHALSTTTGQSKVEAMRERIAAALLLEVNQVNVKAKTAEKLGPVGAGQALEARAVVLLKHQ